MMRRVVVLMMLVLLVAAPLKAQDRGAETAAWQSLAAALQPGTFVEVRTKSGTRFKGTFVQRMDDRVVVKPRTRIPVAAREVPFTDLESIAIAKEGMSPGVKVLIGVGVGVGTFTVLALIAIANLMD